MRDGASLVEFSAHVDVHIATLYEWEKAHPEFYEAKKRAVQVSEAWWTEKGRTKLEDHKFNHVLWYMNMKNRFKWRDKHEVEHSGKIDIHVSADGFDRL